MAQTIIPRLHPAAGGADPTGVDYELMVDAMRDAQMSSYSGPTRPLEAQPGLVWTKEVAGQYTVMLYIGDNTDVALGGNAGVNAQKLQGNEAAYFTNIPARLGFTPVQQGTGADQGADLIKIGWLGQHLGVEVGATNYGKIWPIDISGSAAKLAGEDANFYRDASKLNSGVLAGARHNTQYLDGRYAKTVDVVPPADVPFNDAQIHVGGPGAYTPRLNDSYTRPWLVTVSGANAHKASVMTSPDGTNWQTRGFLGVAPHWDNSVSFILPPRHLYKINGGYEALTEWR